MPRKGKKTKAQKAAQEEAKRARDAAIDEVVTYFAQTYISSGKDRLENFQKLCRDLKVEVGTGLTACKKNIKDAYINIHDFVRVSKAKGDVSTIKFPSYEALQLDIRSDPKTRSFPLESAKGDEVLKAMLIFVIRRRR